MGSTRLISVIVPTYNEKENVLSLIEDIHQELKNDQHEIIVADDNSPDGTYQAVVNRKWSFVKAILREKDRGLANSIRCGIEQARGEIIVVMDSDYNHQPKYLPFMIQSLGHYDCVVASRFVYGGSMGSRSRQILSWVFNIFVRIMTGGQITDSLYGFLAVKKEVLAGVRYDDIFWGYGDYCIRLLYYLQKNGASVLQFPAVNGQRKGGQGNSRFFAVFWQYFTEVLKLTYKIRIKCHASRNQ